MNKNSIVSLGVLTILILLCLSLSSCTKMPIQRNHVLFENVNKRVKPKTRSDKYLNCISRLHNEGVKQSLLKQLCDSSYGGIE